MKQLMTALCFACVLGVASLSAVQADKMDKKMAKGMKSMSVTGCVAEKDGHYMLNHGMMTGDTKAMTYDLMGGDLKPHVGHQVEVMGTSDGKMSKDKMMKKNTMDKSKVDKDKMARSDMHGTLHVSSVKDDRPRLLVGSSRPGADACARPGTLLADDLAARDGNFSRLGARTEHRFVSLKRR